MEVSLDVEQQAAVDYDGSQVIIAGPGSGKTRTLVAKAEKLYARNKEIVCLTFTRAAAREMRTRMPGVKAQTIHSYCYETVGWTGNYDTMLAAVQMARQSGALWDKYEWVLVDEVQDLTEVQWEVVLSLVGRSLFAVGDPYQSIYGWNEALGKEIIQRLQDLGCKEFFLRRNYRSCPEIVVRLEGIYKRGLISSGVKDIGTTAVLTRTRKQVREIVGVLKSRGVGFTVRYGASELTKTREEDHGSDTLKVMTCHCSKGLEFDRVVLYNWFPEPYWGEELNLYYVACARASQDLATARNAKQLLEAVNGNGWDA